MLFLQLQKRIIELEQRLGKNSGNSDRPPSTDPPWKPGPKRSGSGRKPGGQPGHEGHGREYVPEDQVDKKVDVKPDRCGQCGAALKGDPTWVHRHQVTDLPEIKPEVTEYDLFAYRCKCCGEITQAELPPGVPRGAFGPRLMSLVAVLMGMFRLSRRETRNLVQTMYRIDMCTGSVVQCQQAISEVLAQPIEECRKYVESQPSAHVDETGWYQNHVLVWLWVMRAGCVALFQVHASRGRVALQALLGSFKGILVSDRWSAYLVYVLDRRQLCWAHLSRAFQAFVEGSGQAPQIGEALLDRTKRMFQWWHRVRDGTLTRTTFQRRMKPLRQEMEAILTAGQYCGHAPTERTCQRLLKLAPAMWTFVSVEGVEPTNNAAERAVRPAVLWRKGCFGSQSAEGSRFAERMLTATATLKLQNRNVVEYLTVAYHAHLLGRPLPSLLPLTVALAQGR